jgi:hypothetical protein
MGMTRRTVGFLIAIVTLIVGCAGRNFERPQPDALALEKTTYQDILRPFGDPSRKGSGIAEGLPVTSVSYSHASASAGTGWGGVTPGRAISFFFVNDVLVRYEFIM